MRRRDATVSLGQVLLFLFVAPALLTAQGSEPVVIKPGDPAIDGSFIRPVTAKFKITHSAATGPDKDFGTATYQIQVVERDGKSVIERTQVTVNPARTTHDRALADHRTLVPIKGEEYNDQKYEMHHDFEPDRVRSIQSTRPPGGPLVKSELKVDMPVFDFCAGMYELQFASFPLQENYHVKFPAFTCSDEGTSIGWATLRVIGKEKVDAGQGRKVDAWVVETQLNPQWRETLWLAKEPPYVFRFIYYGPKGGHETFQLM